MSAPHPHSRPRRPRAGRRSGRDRRSLRRRHGSTATSPARGPLINRWIARRIRRSLQVDGAPLPSVAPRDDRGARRAAGRRSSAGSTGWLAQALPRTRSCRRARRLCARRAAGEATLGPLSRRRSAACSPQTTAPTGETLAGGLRARRCAAQHEPAARSLAGRSRGRLGGRGGFCRARSATIRPASMRPASPCTASCAALKAMRELVAGARRRATGSRPMPRSSRSLRGAARACSQATGRAGRDRRWASLRPGALTLFELEAARERAPGARHRLHGRRAGATARPRAAIAGAARAVWTRATAGGAERHDRRPDLQAAPVPQPRRSRTASSAPTSPAGSTTRTARSPRPASTGNASSPRAASARSSPPTCRC